MKTNAHPRPEVGRADVGGARLLTVSDHTFPIVHFSFTFRHGALTDGKDAPGALAMLLPWLLRGTQTQSRNAFHETLERLGSTLDTSVGHEMAILHGACLREHVTATLALLRDAIATPRLDEAALADLCEEARQGLVSERDDDDALAELFLRDAFYGDSPLAGSPMGTYDSLGALTPESVGAARAVLCAPWCTAAFAGDISLPDAQRECRVVINALAAHAPPAPPAPPLPAHRGEGSVRVLLVDKPERTQAQVRVALPGLDARHAELEAFWLGIVAFGGTFTSPLTREVRDKRGWSYTAHADFRRRSMFASPVVLRTAPATGDVVDCSALQVQMVADLGQGRLDVADVGRARDYLLGRAPFWTATAYDVLGPAVALELLGLPKERLWDTEQRLSDLALSEVPALLGRTLGGTVPTVVIVGSQRTLLAPLQERFGAEAVRVRAYTDGLGDGQPS